MKKVAYREMYKNEINHFWYVATRNLMIGFLNKYVKRDANILDAGCGTGGTIKRLQKEGFKNIRGIDTNIEALLYCRKRGLKNVLRANINNLPFKDSTFAAIICLDVLYHIGIDPKKALKEFKRVLKKGGIIYLQEPAYNWLTSTHDKAIETRERFTKNQLSNLVTDAELKILKIIYFNSILFPLLATKRIIAKFTNSQTMDSDVKPLPFFLNKLFLITLNLEVKLLHFINLPFGLSIICIAKK